MLVSMYMEERLSGISVFRKEEEEEAKGTRTAKGASL